MRPEPAHPGRRNTSRPCLYAPAAVGVFALLWVLGDLVPSHGAQTCFPNCNPATPESTKACCGEPCLSDAESAFEDCMCQALAKYQECTASNCVPIGGHCELTRDCLNDCRATRADGQRACIARVRGIIRTPLGGGGCAQSVSCRLGAAAARRITKVCFQDGEKFDFSICPTFPEEVTDCSETDEECNDTEDPRNCQRRCARSILQDCYRECRERCEGDRPALAICRQGCRNTNCGNLKRQCTCAEVDENGFCVGRAVSGTYAACCATDACRDALGPDLQCVPTTTITTTTTLTTTSSTTTTTL